VVVASPTRTHENIVSKALDHKKAVFCEKPVAENYDKTKALYEKG
jgi:myo-inositol 2-dehydrogenase/D-chiro-inositol 1-dehydrogenase